MTKTVIIKENIEWGLAYSFRGLAYSSCYFYSYGGEPGGRLGAAEVVESYSLVLEQCLKPQSPSTVTQLQHGHTHCSKVTPPNPYTNGGQAFQYMSYGVLLIYSTAVSHYTEMLNTWHVVCYSLLAFPFICTHKCLTGLPRTVVKMTSLTLDGECIA